MSKMQETQIDGAGDVAGHREIERPRKKGGFGWGLMLGALIIAVAIIAFAYNQGSFQTAGIAADHASRTVQADIKQSAQNVRNGSPAGPNTSSRDQPH